MIGLPRKRTNTPIKGNALKDVNGAGEEAGVVLKMSRPTNPDMMGSYKLSEMNRSLNGRISLPVSRSV